VLKIQFQSLLTNTNLCGKGNRKFGHEEMSWGKRKAIIHLVLFREGLRVLKLMCLGKSWDCGMLQQLRKILLVGKKVAKYDAYLRCGLLMM
jgi:hypothetical protein